MRAQSTSNRPGGQIQVYTGNGKGKTTAALGLALRAAGHGMKTYIGQYMKGMPYGELAALRHFPLITVEQYGSSCCIRKAEVTPAHIAQAQRGLDRAREAMLSGAYAIIVLDEINVAVWFGLLEVSQVLTFVDQRPEPVELVLTGRRAPRALMERADLVTECRNLRHYFDSGVAARKGFEM